MRGLKLCNGTTKRIVPESHLLQMRGLKPGRNGATPLCPLVASFTDAWIETSAAICLSVSIWSHLLQMRGLKQ